MGKLGPYKLNTIVVGDCLQVLRQIPDGVFQMCATSPPYWGLRDYGIPPVVWGGAKGCQHEWKNGTPIAPDNIEHRADVGPHNERGDAFRNSQRYVSQRQFVPSAQFCLHCNAWLGSLGLEPTPELYVEHIVEVFREVKRVLRDDATLWLNLGEQKTVRNGRSLNYFEGGK